MRQLFEFLTWDRIQATLDHIGINSLTVTVVIVASWRWCNWRYGLNLIGWWRQIVVKLMIGSGSGGIRNRRHTRAVGRVPGSMISSSCCPQATQTVGRDQGWVRMTVVRRQIHWVPTKRVKGLLFKDWVRTHFMGDMIIDFNGCIASHDCPSSLSSYGVHTPLINSIHVSSTKQDDDFDFVNKQMKYLLLRELSGVFVEWWLTRRRKEEIVTFCSISDTQY